MADTSFGIMVDRLIKFRKQTSMLKTVAWNWQSLKWSMWSE